MDDYRAASLQAWSHVAPDWGQLAARVDTQLAPATAGILTGLALQPGETVLDLAAGPGTMSLAAARAVGPRGRVICTDFAAPMVDAARKRLAAERVGNVEFRVMDAEAIDLPDESVDAVSCRMGLMLMAAPATAIAEAARVMRPNGRLGFAVWGDEQANPWAALPIQAVAAHLGAPPPPPDAPGGIWSLANADRVRGMLEAAGLGSIRIEEVDAVAPQESIEQWFEITGRLAGPLKALFANLDDATRAAIRTRMAEGARPFERADGSLALPQRMLVAAARRDQSDMPAATLPPPP